jgi:DNA-directed RNA polymerase specialized sigma24 family protein
MWIPKRIKSNLPEISRDLDLRMSAFMRAAQAGDRDAYKELLYASLPLIESVAQRTGASGDKLDDLIEETLIVIHRVRHTYDPSRSFFTWLIAVSLYVSMDKMRGRKRHSIRLRAKPNALSEGGP